MMRQPNYDTLSRLRVMELLEVVTVGLPFCGFKLLAGCGFWTVTSTTAVKSLGVFLICLGALDLLINLGNLFGLLFFKRRILRVCVLDLLMHSERNFPDLGNSLDVLISFTLVSIVISCGILKLLTPELLLLWNICVIFNVMGAGLARFGKSLRKLF